MTDAPQHTGPRRAHGTQRLLLGLPERLLERKRSSGRLGALLAWSVVFADIGTSIYYVPGILHGDGTTGVGRTAAASCRSPRTRSGPWPAAWAAC